MVRSRLVRALAVLLLIVAQGAFGLPHSMMGQAGPAHAKSSGAMPMGDCHHGSSGGTSHQEAPTAPCGSCPSSMPGGTCLEMTSCGPSTAVPATAGLSALATVSVREIAPAVAAPAAHDFIPDPPPPRA